MYANATDGGAPARHHHGQDRRERLTAGQTALALSACTSSCTVGGVTYGYKSSTKTADTLAEGPVAFTVTATDKASSATTGTFSVTVDNTAPTVTAVAVATTTTNAPGWLRKSGAYYVYANATDAASGVYTVKADVSTLTSGQTALALTACTTGCTVGGVTYAYKSASKTAGVVARGRRRRLHAHDRRQGEQLGDPQRLHRHGRQHRADDDRGGAGHGRDQRARATSARAARYVVYADVADATSGVWKADDQRQHVHVRPERGGDDRMRLVVHRRRHHARLDVLDR